MAPRLFIKEAGASLGTPSPSSAPAPSS
jgi:hypothetical protein